MAPVVLGLALAGPVSWLTSRKAGPLARWALATAEERTPPPILLATDARAAEWAARLPRTDADETLAKAA